jgi:hypothetical protein
MWSIGSGFTPLSEDFSSLGSSYLQNENAPCHGALFVPRLIQPSQKTVIINGQRRNPNWRPAPLPLPAWRDLLKAAAWRDLFRDPVWGNLLRGLLDVIWILLQAAVVLALALIAVVVVLVIVAGITAWEIQELQATGWLQFVERRLFGIPGLGK